MEGRQVCDPILAELSKAGGWSDPKPADVNVQQMAHQVIGQLAFYDYKAISYRTQVVEGLNYLIKVQINAKDCIHVKVFEGLDKKITLRYVIYGMTLKDPIEPPRQ